MKIGRLENDTNWNIGFSIRKDWSDFSNNSKIVRVWFFKMKEKQQQAVMINKIKKIGFYKFWKIKI